MTAPALLVGRIRDGRVVCLSNDQGLARCHGIGAGPGRCGSQASARERAPGPHRRTRRVMPSTVCSP
jgi:hypothetical protein